MTQDSIYKMITSQDSHWNLKRQILMNFKGTKKFLNICHLIPIVT